MTEYTLGKREQIAICEEDTWATLGAKTMAANGYIPGKNLVLTPAFTNNWTEILTAGAAARTIDSMQKSALAYKFTLKFVVTDWRFLRYCAHGTVTNTGTAPTVHTFTQTDAVKSFTLEWAKRASTNHVITLTGCIITKVELSDGIVIKALDENTPILDDTGNIANAASPDYVFKEVDFQTVLQASMENPFQVGIAKTHGAHMEQVFEPAVQTEVAPGAEAVDLDRELAKLAENNLMFLAGVQALIKKFEALKVTILEGGR